MLQRLSNTEKSLYRSVNIRDLVASEIASPSQWTWEDRWPSTGMGGRTRTPIKSEAEQLKELVIALQSKMEALSQQLAECTSKIKDLCDEATARPTIKETELLDIGDGFDTLRPIHVIIEESEDEAIVSLPEIELSARGGTESEAILNFKEALISLYADLAGTPKAKLGRLPTSWLKILQKVMQPIG